MKSGVQLGLFSNEDDVANETESWLRDQRIREESDEFAEHLVAVLGLSVSSAKVSSRFLAAMVRESGAPTLAAFFEASELVVKGLRATSSRKTRRERYRAACDYLNVMGAPLDHREGIAVAIEREFGGRSSPRADLVDLQLGGNPKEVRARLYPTWDDGGQMIRSAQGANHPARSKRDSALVAMHVRSGLPPGLIDRLDWSSVAPLMVLPMEFSRVRLEYKGRIAEFAIHSEALSRLQLWWQSEGMPDTGPVFTTLRRPNRRLSDSTVRDLIIPYALEVGLPSLDRRHLRAAFAWRLKQDGWSDIRIRDAFGYLRVRELIRLIRPLEERAAQIAATEFLVLPDPSVASSSEPAEERRDDRNSGRHAMTLERQMEVVGW